MPRSPRSDIKIGNLEKKLGLSEGAIRNPDGTNARSDKLLKTLRKEYQRMAAGPPVRTSASVKAAAASVQAKRAVTKTVSTLTTPKPKAAPKAAPVAKPKPKAATKAKASAKPKAVGQSKPAGAKKTASKKPKK